MNSVFRKIRQRDKYIAQLYDKLKLITALYNFHNQQRAYKIQKNIINYLYSIEIALKKIQVNLKKKQLLLYETKYSFKYHLCYTITHINFVI